MPHFWLQLISVILAILIGFLFLRDPAQGMMTLALLLIVFGGAALAFYFNYGRLFERFFGE